MCLSYSLIIPYIVLIAVFFFVIKYNYNKNLLMTVFFIDCDSRGAVSQVVLKALIICVAVFWLISGVMLMLTANTIFVSLGSFIVLLSVITVILILCYDKRLWSLAGEEEEVEEAKPLMESDGNEYIHPCLLRSEEDPYTLTVVPKAKN